MTINRFCSSGVQAVALAADRIRLGEADVMIAAGTESMSMVPMGGNKPTFSPAVFEKDENVAIAYGMGITAEQVAAQWKVSREEQDMFAADSHRRAVRATDTGEFTRRDHAVLGRRSVCPISPRAKSRYGRAKLVTDEGPRRDTSPETLAKLRPAFAAKGSVTAGNSSQMSDGAAAVVLMSEAALNRYSVTADRALRRLLGRGRAARHHGHRAGEGDSEGARAGGTQAGRHRLDRIERSVRRPGAGGDRGAGPRPREGESAGRRDRAGTSARRDRRDPHRDAAARPAAPQESTAW